MEATFHRHDAWFARCLARQLQRGLVGFGAGVAEEDVAESLRSGLREQLGGPRPYRAVGHIRVEHQRLGLLLYRLHDARRAMAEQRHTVSSIKVKVSIALCVPNIAPLAAHERQRHLRIRGNLEGVFEVNRCRCGHSLLSV